MRDFLRLDQCCPSFGKGNIQEELAGVFTPLKLAQWGHMLAHHPDREYVDYVLSGHQGGIPDRLQERSP